MYLVLFNEPTWQVITIEDFTVSAIADAFNTHICGTDEVAVETTATPTKAPTKTPTKVPTVSQVSALDCATSSGLPIQVYVKTFPDYDISTLDLSTGEYTLLYQFPLSQVLAAVSAP